MKKSDKFIPLAKPCIGGEEIENVVEVIKSGMWTTGRITAEFENKFSEYIGKDISSVALTSCTAGLYLSLLALGIGANDEVIVPTWTFAATAQVVEWAGAKLVLCDVEEDTLNIDIKKTEKLITKKTKAIIPVHFAGYPCDMERLDSLAKKYNLYVIDDAAHAVGTEYKKIKIGNFSDCAVFSFYATKNLACGEGGMVVSKNKELIEKIRKLSYFGINKSAFNRYSEKGNWYYEIEQLGYKFNYDDIHSAIGIAQLKRIDTMNARRRKIAEIYKKKLDKKIMLTRYDDIHFHNYHLFPVILPKVIDRDSFILKLKEMNIGTSVHFIPLHKHPYYRNKFADAELFIADEVFGKVVSLPMYPDLSDSEVEYIADNVNLLVNHFI